ncbi:MAG: hypothetical protein K2N04_01265, partial [Alistipes sp.]|nr:hypothetical protein [Alistipes sp.]
VRTVHSAPKIRCKDVCFLFRGAVSYLSQSVPRLPTSASSGHSFQRLLAKTFAAGRRNNASGALTEVGTRGLYWASSSYAAGNINAAFLDFTSGNVNPLNTGNRADAFSVRCVQASTGCFLSFSVFRQKNRGGELF